MGHSLCCRGTRHSINAVRNTGPVFRVEGALKPSYQPRLRSGPYGLIRIGPNLSSSLSTCCVSVLPTPLDKVFEHLQPPICQLRGGSLATTTPALIWQSMDFWAWPELSCRQMALIPEFTASNWTHCNSVSATDRSSALKVRGSQCSAEPRCPF